MDYDDALRSWRPYRNFLLTGALVCALISGVVWLSTRDSGGGAEELAVRTQNPVPVSADGRAGALYETACAEYIDEAQIGNPQDFTHSFSVADVAACVYEDCDTGRWDCGAWTADDWYSVIVWALSHCSDLREGGWKHECWEGETETSRLLLEKLADDKTAVSAEAAERSG